MAKLTPPEVQRIFEKNGQLVTLEEAEEVLNLLFVLARIAVEQTLRAEQTPLTKQPTPEEPGYQKTNHNIQ